MEEGPDGYGNTIEGDDLDALGLDQDVRQLTRKLVVLSETSFLVDLGAQTVTADVQPPTAGTPDVTLRVEVTITATGARAVVARAYPLEDTSPVVPNGALVSLAVHVAGLYAGKVLGLQRAAASFLSGLQSIAVIRGLTEAGQAALADHRVMASWVRDLTGDVVLTLTVRFEGGVGAPPRELFE